MKKAVLIVSLSDSCYDCNLCHTKDYDWTKRIDGDKFCGIEDINVDDYYINNLKPDWCPLKPLPEKSTTGKSNYYQWGDWEDGWNACIDHILSKENKT